MKRKNQNINSLKIQIKAQAICLCLFLLMPALLSADDIILNNGNVLQGIVGEETDSFLEFHTSSGSIKLPRSKIKKIYRGTDEQNEFYRLDIGLRKRKLADVLKSLRKFQQNKFNAEKLPAMISKTCE